MWAPFTSSFSGRSNLLSRLNFLKLNPRRVYAWDDRVKTIPFFSLPGQPGTVLKITHCFIAHNSNEPLSKCIELFYTSWMHPWNAHTVGCCISLTACGSYLMNSTGTCQLLHKHACFVVFMSSRLLHDTQTCVFQVKWRKYSLLVETAHPTKTKKKKQEARTTSQFLLPIYLQTPIFILEWWSLEIITAGGNWAQSEASMLCVCSRYKRVVVSWYFSLLIVWIITDLVPVFHWFIGQLLSGDTIVLMFLFCDWLQWSCDQMITWPDGLFAWVHQSHLVGWYVWTCFCACARFRLINRERIVRSWVLLFSRW